ncbi:MAG: NAD(P)/FAD-dependent oxidoreductase [Clostridiales bacterium]|nr:NAD(P)/FAD-dependent oxidoreductase [Clostridiales bacterium]
MFDFLIIGSGPAGISAALYACRANLSTAVLGKDTGALEKAEKIENYYGLDHPLSGAEPFQNGIRQAKALGAEFLREEVTGMKPAGPGKFTVETAEGTYETKSILLATGAKRQVPRIENLSKFEGKGVSYCAVCDAFFHRGRDVAVLGHGPYAMQEARELLPIVGSVTLLTNGQPLAAEVPEGVAVMEQPVKALAGEKLLESVQFEDGTRQAFTGLFVALGNAGAGDLARKLGAPVEGSRVAGDADMKTLVPGLYAAGDCIGGVQQVSVAVGEGAKAALNAISYIRKLNRN